MEKEILTENGIALYYDQNPHIHGFSLALYLRAGCLYENETENGIAHFYEHIAVRNLNARMNGELYRVLDCNGLTLNASTGKEHICFEIVGAVEHYETACSILMGFLEPITLPSSEIAIERNRVKAEIREDDENSTLASLRRKLIWEDTTLSRPITGTISTLNRFGKTALNRFRESLIAKQNYFFYVTGNLSDEQIRDTAKHFAAAPLSDQMSLRKTRASLPTHYRNRERVIQTKSGSATRISISFDLPLNECNYEEASLLYDVLFCGETSLLFMALSETTGMIYSFSPSFEYFINIGAISVEYEVSSAKLLESFEALLNVLVRMKSAPVEQLECVKPFYVDNAGLLSDDCSERNWLGAYEGHILYRPYRSLEERANSYRHITAEKISELAKVVFQARNMVVCLKSPKKSASVNQLAALIDRYLPEPSKQ